MPIVDVAEDGALSSNARLVPLVLLLPVVLPSPRLEVFVRSRVRTSFLVVLGQVSWDGLLLHVAPDASTVTPLNAEWPRVNAARR